MNILIFVYSVSIMVVLFSCYTITAIFVVNAGKENRIVVDYNFDSVKDIYSRFKVIFLVYSGIIKKNPNRKKMNKRIF